MDRPDATRPTFFWRGILILLPLLLLAGMGLYSLRQDRLLAGVEAKERCQNIAENYAGIISSRLSARMESLSSTQILSETIILDPKYRLFSIDGSRERAEMHQVPNPKPVHFQAQARYDLGLLLARNHDVTKATELFHQVETDPYAMTESGLPLWLLAELQCVELAPSKPGNIYRDAVNNPCFVTPIILARLSELDPAHSVENRKWLNTWVKDEATRDFYTHVQPGLGSELREGGILDKVGRWRMVGFAYPDKSPRRDFDAVANGYYWPGIEGHLAN